MKIVGSRPSPEKGTGPVNLRVPSPFPGWRVATAAPRGYIRGMGQRVHVKICGVTNEADGRQAALLGADAVGINFHAPSPRAVSLPTAEFILRELPPFVEAVAVYVDEPLRNVFPM